MPFTKTFHGFIENTTDTLLIIEACRNGILPTVNRRLIERERSAIDSGTIIVFDESESGIKRWTDGFLWSPSRILGNFLVYRELANRETRKIDDDDYSLLSPLSKNDDVPSIDVQQRERALVGSLTASNTSYNFKKDGLIKKTIRIMVNGNYLHIVNYYSKNDVLQHRLPTPSASPQLACLQISADLMPHLQGYPSQQQQTTGDLSSSANSDERKKRRSSSRDLEDRTIHQRPRILPPGDSRHMQHQQQQPYMLYGGHHHPSLALLNHKNAHTRYDYVKPNASYSTEPLQQMTTGPSLSSSSSAPSSSLATSTRGFLYV